jgi:hypothetical protein
MAGLRSHDETKPWILPLSEPVAAPDAERGLLLIRGASLRELRRQKFLEFELIPALGLNNELLEEQPRQLQHLFGAGLGWRIWQYPNQFARYLSFLARRANRIATYLEIGSRYGGTFCLTAAYLQRFNPDFSSAVAVDLIPEPRLIADIRCYLPVQYLQTNSTSNDFKLFMRKNNFDLALIDGDHSFEGITRDYELVYDNTAITVFHDINSIRCPGTTYFWRVLRVASRGTQVKTHEFIDTYPDVPAVGPFLGIGCVERIAS